MTVSVRLAEQLRRLRTNSEGNIAIIAAIALPVVIFGVGVALDTSRMASERQRLQMATDAGATAAAAALANDPTMKLSEAEKLATEYVKIQMKASTVEIPDDCIKAKAVKQSGYGTQKSYDVTVTACANYSVSGMTRIFSGETKSMSTLAVAHSDTGTKKSLSMYLVLDRSGSMNSNTKTKTSEVDPKYDCASPQNRTIDTLNGWGRRRPQRDTGPKKCIDLKGNKVSKMQALQLASFELLQQIADADPEKKYARLGAVSYNERTTDKQDLTWGTDATFLYVENLKGGGRTNSAPAMKTAYDALSAMDRKLGMNLEDAMHKVVNQQKPDKYIVFMTDGANNEPGADPETRATCDAAKSKGYEIYSVAFLAPTAGQRLLKYCATDDSHYFTADSAEEMIAAFKSIGEKASEKMTILTQ